MLNILVIRLSSMGDVLIPMGLLNQIKDIHHKRVRLTYLTSEEFAPLIQEDKNIDEVMTFQRRVEPLSTLLKRIEKKHQEKPFDLILDLHSTMRSLLIRWRFFSIPRLVVDKRRFERFLLTKFKINLLKGEDHQAQRQVKRLIQDFSSYFHLPEKTEKKQLSSSSFLYQENKIPKEIEEKIEGYKLICFFPSASFETKRWPVDSFKALIRQMLKDQDFNEYKFAILAGPKDEFCREFDELALENKRVLNLFAQTNLKESAQMTKRASVCVGNDTGLLHISESVGTPVVMIFGPTSEFYGFAPYLEKSKYLSHSLWCRPCSTTGKKKCFRREPYCLTQTAPRDVLQAIKEVLQ